MRLLHQCALFLGIGLLLLSPTEARERPEHIPLDVWRQVEEYLLPEEHPAHSILDQIFENGGVLKRLNTMRDAGFRHVKPRRYTRVIVADHPSLSGYLIKAYAESQRAHSGRPSWKTWLKRVHGAQLLRRKIDKRKLGHWFRVPRKWLYLLPTPSFEEDALQRQDFILLVEKEPLTTRSENHRLWGRCNKDCLKAFFQLVTELGLSDSAKCENAPFCRDGRITFIDTELFGKWPVEYHKLMTVLPLYLREFWFHLISKEANLKR